MTTVERKLTRSRARRWAAFLLTCSLGLLTAARSEAAANLLVYAITTDNTLLTFRTNAPGSLLSAKSVTGLAGGEQILAIDFRPATGQLFALGSTSRLYIINPLSGAATAVGTGFAPALSGTAFGFDFNPVVDRIRVVSDTGQSIRLNPNTGALAAVDTLLTPATAGAVAAAYTDNFPGATSTTLYVIDVVSDMLVRQGGPGGNPSPNGGVLTAIGALGINANSVAGFDVAHDGRAFAVLNVGPTSALYSINLTTGAATLISTISGGQVRGLAVAATGNRVDEDFDGDGKADIGVFRRSSGEWIILRSSDGGTTHTAFGSGSGAGLGDVAVPADYDGDGRADLAIFRQTSAQWFIVGSSVGFFQVTFGAGSAAGFGDAPVPADYDGDGKADLGIYRVTTGQWFILNTSTGAVTTINWGSPALDDTPARR